MQTVWVLGDQLNRRLGPLREATPADTRVLLVESTAKLASARWHVQRAHLVLTAMRRFATELREEGFEVDHRRSASLPAGLAEHRARYRPARVVAMEPASYDGLLMLRRHGVEVTRSDQFLCHYGDFADWVASRRSVRMEDFYRHQRRRLGYLMDGDEPAGGRWNFDADNREPPPRDGRAWPLPLRTPLDGVDRAVLADLAALGENATWGAPPDGTWATSRAEALRRLEHAVTAVLPAFGPHEDAMLSTNWHLAHTLLSPYLNLGLLLPAEVCDAAEAAHRAGRVPIASAEGFIRQVIGWREYVWGRYWQWVPDHRSANELGAHRPLPPVFADPGVATEKRSEMHTEMHTEMRCLATVLRDVHDHGWTHHIQRLMVLGSHALQRGYEPRALNEWFSTAFVDGFAWVMPANVLGMSQHADGGRMATSLKRPPLASVR